MANNKCVFILCSSRTTNDVNNMTKRYISAPVRSINALATSSKIEKVNIGDLPTEKFPEITDIQFDVSNEHTDTLSLIDLSDISYKHIEIYLRQYTTPNMTFENYIMTLLMNSVLLSSFDSMERRIRRINMLTCSEELLFWQLPNNCKINVTEQYMERNVTMASYRKIKKDDLVPSNTELSDPELSDYLDNMLNYTSKYVDAALTKTYFPITDIKNLIVDYDIITRLLTSHMIDNYEKVLLVMSIMAMPIYCHLIINNKSVLQFIKDSCMFKDSPNTYSYLMQYAWLSFYMEESIKKSNIKESDRYILEIDTAAALPKMTTPFLTAMIDNDIPTLQKNLFPPSWDSGDELGVCTFKTFKTRMNIFMSGDDVSLLDGLKWDNCVLCGSMMACCTPLFNPLMLNVKESDDVQSNATFDRFASKYYSDADIDVACKGTISEFIDMAYEFRDVLERNVRKHFDHMLNELSISDNSPTYEEESITYDSKINVIDIQTHEDDEDVVKPKKKRRVKCKKIINRSDNVVRINYSKQMNVTINYEFIRENFYTPSEKAALCEEDESKCIADKVVLEKYISLIENINRMDYNNSDETKRAIDIIYDVYLAYQKNENENIDKIRLEYHDVVSKDNIRIFMSTSTVDNANTECIAKCTCSIKYRISCKIIKHDFELFKIRGDHFFASISQFHFPIVRSYYRGNNVYMTPTSVAACKTLINIDYKFFAGIRDPVLIWIKYYFRGFGFLFNTNELKKLVSFCVQNPSIASKFTGIDFTKAHSISTLFNQHMYDNIYEGNACVTCSPRYKKVYVFPYHKNGTIKFIKLHNAYSSIGRCINAMKMTKSNAMTKTYVLPRINFEDDKINDDEENDDKDNNEFIPPYKIKQLTSSDIDNLDIELEELESQLKSTQNRKKKSPDPEDTFVINHDNSEVETDDKGVEEIPQYVRSLDNTNTIRPQSPTRSPRSPRSLVENSDEEEESDEDDILLTPPRKKVTKKTRTVIDFDESDDSDEVDCPPRKQIGTKKKKKLINNPNEEYDGPDEEDDSDELLSSDEESCNLVRRVPVKKIPKKKTC